MSFIILVDENDNQIGFVPKLEAHLQNKLHRAFSIFLLRISDTQELEMLLQKRHSSKYHSAGLWSNTCCSHPTTQDTEQEAIQRLFEETGIKTSSLTKVGTFKYEAKLDQNLWEHEIDHVFISYYDGLPFTVNPEEIEDTIWVSFDRVEHWLSESPEAFTAWFKEAFELVKGYFLEISEL